MPSIGAVYWLLLLSAKLTVAPAAAVATQPPFDFRPACYNTDSPTIQQNDEENLPSSEECLLGAASVQILLWPTETLEPSACDAPNTVTQVASGIVSNGVTFISPSVYVAYHRLEAYTSCPSNGFTAIGDSHDTTIAYAPGDLSESISATTRQTCVFSAINYADLSDFSLHNTTDFTFSLPNALTSVDPEWSTCSRATYGTLDPPRTLPPATALTHPATGSKPSTPATSGSSVGSAHGPSTTTLTTTSSTSSSRVFQSSTNPGVPRTSDPPSSQKPADPRTSDPPSSQKPAVPRTSDPPSSQKPAVPRASDPPRSSPAVPVASAVKQDWHDTAASKSSSFTQSDKPDGESKWPRCGDPTKTLSTPGFQTSHDTAASEDPLHTHSRISGSESKIPDPDDPTNRSPLPDTQTSHGTPTSQYRSYVPSVASRGESRVPDPNDPSNTSPVPIDHEHGTKSIHDAPMQTPTATANSSKIALDPLNRFLRLLDPSLASAGHPTSSSNTIPPGNISNQIKDSSSNTHLVKADPLTFPNEITASPSPSSNEINTESHITNLPPNAPTTTYSSPARQTVSSTPNNDIIPSSTTPGTVISNNSTTSTSPSTSNITNIPTPASTEGHDSLNSTRTSNSIFSIGDTRPSTKNATTTTNNKIYTSSNERLSYGTWMRPIWVLTALSIAIKFAAL